MNEVERGGCTDNFILQYDEVNPCSLWRCSLKLLACDFTLTVAISAVKLKKQGFVGPGIKPPETKKLGMEKGEIEGEKGFDGCDHFRLHQYCALLYNISSLLNRNNGCKNTQRIITKHTLAWFYNLIIK